MSELPRPAAFVSRPPDRVLFLCIHNSSRSQIAEAWARELAPREVEVYSAGSEPRGVHPMAIEVMAEVGLSLDSQRSKHLDEVPWRTVDTVVTLCAEGAEACPTVAGDVRRVHWPLPDPSAAPEAERRELFREVRDEIRWRVSALWPRGD